MTMATTTTASTVSPASAAAELATTNGGGESAASVSPVANGKPKKLHGRAFYESIGSPKYIVAPMVDQSEFAWRMLIRSFLPADKRNSILAYSPMLHARLFNESPKYKASHFEATKGAATAAGQDTDVAGSADTAGTLPHLDGNPAIDRPLFVQFCANDPDHLLNAARQVAPHCDAVDLNLGCPQGIARKGHYGAFLQEEPELIATMVRTLHENLDVPVTAKIRVLETREASLQYARTVLDAGASILTVHGRRREQKGHLTGLADWSFLRYLRENLPPETVLFANGNVLQPGDVTRCLEATGFDGVMSAEGLLSDPALFGTAIAGPVTNDVSIDGGSSNCWWPTPSAREYWTSPRDPRRGGWRVDAIVRRYLDILHVYVLGAAAPPERKPLFVRGDDVSTIPEEPAVPVSENHGDAGKKRKRGQDAAVNDAMAAGVLDSANFAGVQAHLFNLLRHAVSKHHDVRDQLARLRKGDMAACERVLGMLERRVALALAGEEGEDKVEKEAADTEAKKESAETNAQAEEVEEIVDDPESSEGAVRRCKRPWWVAQAIIRPMPAEALAKGAIQPKKKKGKDGKDKTENGRNGDTA